METDSGELIPAEREPEKVTLDDADRELVREIVQGMYENLAAEEKFRDRPAPKIPLSWRIAMMRRRRFNEE